LERSQKLTINAQYAKVPNKIAKINSSTFGVEEYPFSKKDRKGIIEADIRDDEKSGRHIAAHNL